MDIIHRQDEHSEEAILERSRQFVLERIWSFEDRVLQLKAAQLIVLSMQLIRFQFKDQTPHVAFQNWQQDLLRCGDPSLKFVAAAKTLSKTFEQAEIGLLSADTTKLVFNGWGLSKKLVPVTLSNDQFKSLKGTHDDEQYIARAALLDCIGAPRLGYLPLSFGTELGAEPWGGRFDSCY
jgi:hypothetical protein